MFYTYFKSDGVKVRMDHESRSILAQFVSGFRREVDGYVFDVLDGENEMQGADRFRHAIEKAGGLQSLFYGKEKMSYLKPILIFNDQSRWAPESLQEEIAEVREALGA